MKQLREGFLGLTIAALAACASGEASENINGGVPYRSAPEIRGEEHAVLTAAPNVPPPITRTYNTRVIVELETTEKVMRLADSVPYAFWTFNGIVPGSFIRVREGDLVEVRIRNHEKSLYPHNIDLHAATGPGGGAAASLVMPGGEATFTFTALNPGLYVYHCAMSPVPEHIGNGMYGLILVEPKAGMPKVDREFYVMQSEFYAKPGKAGAYVLDVERGMAENPTHVVFNGSVGSMVGENVIKAKVGESIRMYVGNGGPNLSSNFHVIGEVFDNVYGEGGSSISQRNVQTTIVPAGGAAMVDFRAEKSGMLIMVDHAIFRAFNKGAIGMLKIEGDDDPTIFKQLKGMPALGNGH